MAAADPGGQVVDSAMVETKTCPAGVAVQPYVVEMLNVWYEPRAQSSHSSVDEGAARPALQVLHAADGCSF